MDENGSIAHGQTRPLRDPLRHEKPATVGQVVERAIERVEAKQAKRTWPCPLEREHEHMAARARTNASLVECLRCPLRWDHTPREVAPGAEQLLADVDDGVASAEELLDDLVQSLRRNARSLGLTSRQRLLTDAEIGTAERLARVLVPIVREQRMGGNGDEPEDLSKLSREDLEKRARGGR